MSEDNFQKFKKRNKSFNYEGRDGKRLSKGNGKRDKKRSRGREKEEFLG